MFAFGKLIAAEKCSRLIKKMIDYGFSFAGSISGRGWKTTNVFGYLSQRQRLNKFIGKFGKIILYESEKIKTPWCHDPTGFRSPSCRHELSSDALLWTNLNLCRPNHVNETGPPDKNARPNAELLLLIYRCRYRLLSIQHRYLFVRPQYKHHRLPM